MLQSLVLQPLPGAGLAKRRSAFAIGGRLVARNRVARNRVARSRVKQASRVASTLSQRPAGDAKHADVLERLKGKLIGWMKEQGDKGAETELDALARQRRYAGMTREEAVEAWQSAKKKKASKAPGKKRKRTAKKPA